MLAFLSIELRQSKKQTVFFFCCGVLQQQGRISLHFLFWRCLNEIHIVSKINSAEDGIEEDLNEIHWYIFVYYTKGISFYVCLQDRIVSNYRNEY